MLSRSQAGEMLVVPTIVLNLAYVALVASTFTRTVVWLRLMILAGSCFFITYGLLVGIPSMVFWNVLTGSLHVANLVRIAVGRRHRVVGPTEDWFRRNVFADMDPRQFDAIWSRGRDIINANCEFTRQDVAHNRVALIVSGVVEVYVDRHFVRRLGPGSFLGEMSFVSGGVACADTWARGSVVLREWDRDDLITLSQANVSAARFLDQSIMRSLVWKMIVPASSVARRDSVA